jgi:hypothetical protein
MKMADTDCKIAPKRLLSVTEGPPDLAGKAGKMVRFAAGFLLLSWVAAGGVKTQAAATEVTQVSFVILRVTGIQ